MAVKATKHTLKFNHSEPTLIPSHTPLDSLIRETKGDEQGWPTSMWVSFSGKPGALKTTLGLQVLNGLGMNPGVYTQWIDREMESYRCKQMYDRLGLSYISELDTNNVIGGALLKSILGRAKELQQEKKSYIVLVDSWNYLCESVSTTHQRVVAEQLRASRESCPNMIILTINHLTKSGSISGPAEVQRNPDILLHMERIGDFVYTHPLKNRVVAEDAPSHLKFSITSQGLVPTTEPDFISNNPLVQLWRKWRT